MILYLRENGGVLVVEITGLEELIHRVVREELRAYSDRGTR